jgi:hypothetical protein
MAHGDGRGKVAAVLSTRRHGLTHAAAVMPGFDDSGVAAPGREKVLPRGTPGCGPAAGPYNHMVLAAAARRHRKRRTKLAVAMLQC